MPADTICKLSVMRDRFCKTGYSLVDEWYKFLIYIFTFCMTTSIGAADVKIPQVISQKVQLIQSKFAAILEEECPEHMCYSVGCAVGNFIVLDQVKDSSLPGLETDSSSIDTPQFKLDLIRCEFAHEPELNKSNIETIRQRLQQRLKPSGVRLHIVAKQLKEKPSVKDKESLSDITIEESNEMLGWENSFKKSILPILPWVVLLFSLVACILLLIWGYRSLGREAIVESTIDSQSDATNLLQTNMIEKAEPSPTMIMGRISLIKNSFEHDPKLVEFTLKPFFDGEKYQDLCLFLKHFGPEYMSSLSDNMEFKNGLAHLSKVYSASEIPDSNIELWNYLEKLEREMVSAKIKINNEPLEDEFTFLASLDVNELLSLLKECTDMEAVAIISYAPKKLREEFFAIAPVGLTSRVVKELMNVDRLPDSFIREVANKIRTYYQQNAKDIKSVRVQKNALIESALNSLDDSHRQQLILGLKEEKNDMLLLLSPDLFLDESLLHLDDELLTEVFLELPPRDAASYLANFEWGEQLVGRIKLRVAESIKKFLANPSLLDMGMVDIARKRIADFLRKKQKVGAIDLTAINHKILGK